MFLEKEDKISLQFYYNKDYQFSSVCQIFLALASKNTDLMVNSNLDLKSHVEVQELLDKLCLGGPVFCLV